VRAVASLMFQGRMDSKWSVPLTSGLTSVPNPVRPRHVGDRSRVLRTRDLSASFLQSKRYPPWRGASPPHAMRAAQFGNYAHPGIVVCSPPLSDKRQVEWSAVIDDGSRWTVWVRSEMLGQIGILAIATGGFSTTLIAKFPLQITPLARREHNEARPDCAKARKHPIFR